MFLKNYINRYKDKKMARNKIMEIQDKTLFLGIYYLNNLEKLLCYDLYDGGHGIVKDFLNIVLEVIEPMVKSYNLIYFIENKSNCEKLFFSYYKEFYNSESCGFGNLFYNGSELILTAKNYNPNLINFYYKDRIYEDNISIFGYKEYPVNVKSFDEIKNELNKNEYDINIEYNEVDYSILSIIINTEKFDKDYVFSLIKSKCEKYNKILDVNIST